jgi:hypothetical protein
MVYAICLVAVELADIGNVLALGLQDGSDHFGKISGRYLAIFELGSPSLPTAS